MKFAMSNVIQTTMFVLLVLPSECQGRHLTKRRVFPQICLSTSDCTGLNQVCVRTFSGFGHCVSRTDMPNSPDMDEHEKDNTYVKIDEGFIEGLGEAVSADDPDHAPTRRKRAANGIEHDVDDAGPASHRRKKLNLRKKRHTKRGLSDSGYQKRSLGLNAKELADSFKTLLKKESSEFYNELDLVMDKLERLIQLNSKIPLPVYASHIQAVEGDADTNGHIEVNIVHTIPQLNSKEADADHVKQYDSSLQSPTPQSKATTTKTNYKPSVGNKQVSGFTNIQVPTSENNTKPGSKNGQVTDARNKETHDSDSWAVARQKVPVSKNHQTLETQNEQAINSRNKHIQGFKNRQVIGIRKKPKLDSHNKHVIGFGNKQAPGVKNQQASHFGNKQTQVSLNRQTPRPENMLELLPSDATLDQKIEALGRMLTVHFPNNGFQATGHHPGLEKMSKQNRGQITSGKPDSTNEIRLRYISNKSGHKPEVHKKKGLITERKKTAENIRLSGKHKVDWNKQSHAERQHVVPKTAERVHKHDYKGSNNRNGHSHNPKHNKNGEFDGVSINKELSRQELHSGIMEGKEHNAKGSPTINTGVKAENNRGKTRHRYKLVKMSGHKPKHGRKIATNHETVMGKTVNKIKNKGIFKHVTRVHEGTSEIATAANRIQNTRPTSKPTTTTQTVVDEDSGENQSIDNTPARTNQAAAEINKDKTDKLEDNVSEPIQDGHSAARDRGKNEEAGVSGRPTPTPDNEDATEEIPTADEYERQYRMRQMEGKTTVRSVSPSEGPSVSPSEGPSVSPSEGRSVSPSEGRSVSPSEGRSVSPSEGRRVSPSEGRSASPSDGQQDVEYEVEGENGSGDKEPTEYLNIYSLEYDEDVNDDEKGSIEDVNKIIALIQNQ